MTVLAVLLTFDSPSTLVRCVQHVLGQTRQPDHLLVVDNAGAAVARETLQDAGLLAPHLTVLRTEANLGPAGGYATGLAWAQQADYDIAWVMDDDCAPVPSSLSHLLATWEREGPEVVVFPQEVEPRSGIAMNYHSWCGVLLPVSVIDLVGLPRTELFWWMEDSEYLHFRMDAADIPIVRDRQAIVYHDRSRRGSDLPVWKIYYEARNTTYVRLHLRRHHIMRRWVRPMLLQFARIIRQDDLRMAKLGAFLQGVVDGHRGRLGKRFPTG